MKRFIFIVTLLCGMFAIQQVFAQPPSRRAEQENRNAGPTLSVRAQTQYTPQVDMPEEVMWKREIYREIVLKEEKNAALYYPVQPMGNRMNMFTLMFNLIAEGKLPAYEYRLDGTEDLTENSLIDFREILDRFHVYYEEEIQNRDTLLIVDNSDIPSSEVLSYFIKEDWYFDQRSSTYNSRVVALCPVIHRSDDFSAQDAKYPMFWVSYNDLAPYLGRMPVMTSNINNTASITLNDYFTSRLFKGDIYKTTNMLNLSLREYCPTDSALVQEQQRIEKQLVAFGNNLWESTKIIPEEIIDPADPTLLIAQDTSATGSTKGVVKNNSKRKGRDKAESSSSSSTTKVKKESTPKSSSSSSGPRVSVRRERR